MTDTYDYTNQDLDNPRGKNYLSSIENFFQRSLYKERIYPTTFPAPLDTWYNKELYGRIDQFQNSIMPMTANMVAITSATKKNMMALNVVVSAFEKFVSHIERAAFAGILKESGNPKIYNIKAHKAYESTNNRYASFTQSMFNIFMNNLTGDQSDAIKDFQSFLPIYRQFLLEVASVTPVTRTNYLISNNGSKFTSGICIAIANGDIGDDEKKYKDFIDDPNFEFFRKCAKKFGFMINKNAPWILTADLFSTAFQETALSAYLLPNGDRITKENFFNVYYDKTHLTDFNFLINILMNSYNQLVDRSPYYDKGRQTLGASTCNIKPQFRGKLEISPKQRIDGLAGSNQVLTDKFLIDLYIDMRQTEVLSPLSPIRLRSVKTQAYEVYQVQPNKEISRLQNVADYVNVTFRDYIYDFGSLALQLESGVDFSLDNRVRDGKILVEKNISRQLY